MSQAETKSLREKLTAWQDYMENEVTAGRVDLENTPKVFDRARYAVNSLSREGPLRITCFHCSKPFKEDRSDRTTSDHIRFWHIGCEEAYDRDEEIALRKQDK